MRGSAQLALIASGALIAGASLYAAAQADLRVSRSSESLKHRPSTFTRIEGPRTTFTAAAGPATAFRLSEVAPERLKLTQELLTSLKARQTASQAIVVDLPADVLFDFDKATLRADARPTLDRTAELLRSYPTAPVTVEGHTDSLGDAAYNQDLSLKRARTVAEGLKARIGKTSAVSGFGEARPLAPNAKPDGSDDPAGRQRNRRVEVHIQSGAIR